MIEYSNDPHLFSNAFLIDAFIVVVVGSMEWDLVTSFVDQVNCSKLPCGN